MIYTAIGLILATMFGIFFGSEGEMNPEMMAAIFWGLIAGGAFINALLILKDWVYHRCKCRLCPHPLHRHHSASH